MNAPAAGRITEHLANEEDTVSVGQDLFRFEPGAAGEAAPKEQKSEEPKETKDAAEPKDQQVDKSTPPPPAPSPEEVRKPDPAGVQGGTAKKEVKETSKPAPKESKQPTPTPRVPGSRGETRVKMNRMRLRIAERLKESQNAAASLTTFNEIDMSSVMEMRKKYKDEVLKEHDVKLGFMSAFAKACSLALKEIPAANASIDGEEIVYRDYVDLSVAVATPKGLVTPVVRNAEGMNFIEIEKEIAALGKKVSLYWGVLWCTRLTRHRRAMASSPWRTWPVVPSRCMHAVICFRRPGADRIAARMVVSSARFTAPLSSTCPSPPFSVSCRPYQACVGAAFRLFYLHVLHDRPCGGCMTAALQ